MLAGFSTEAQTSDSSIATKGKVSISIVKDHNGKKSVIDTTFDLGNEQAMQEFFDKQSIDVQVYKDGSREPKVLKYQMEIEGGNGDEKEVTVVIPPMPPVAPVPPGTPTFRPGDDNSNVHVYSFKVDPDDAAIKLDELEKLLEDAMGSEMKIKKEIKRIEIRDGQSEKKRKHKKGGRKIIIIEEA